MTSKVDYDQPAIPAVVERAAPRIEEFTRIPTVPDSTCKSGDMQFVATIRDLNREEDLDLRILINGEIVDSTSSWPANNKEQREDYRFCLKKTEFEQPCNLLELLVSAEFKGSATENPRQTRYDDLASTHWWVIGEASETPNASYLDCLDAGVP